MTTPAPVIANPPAFPGSRPRGAPYFPITKKNDIFADYYDIWALHTHLTHLSKEAIGDAFVGKQSFARKDELDDRYRTNRYDLASHYVRGFEHVRQPMPLTAPEQITSPVGRALVVLLDQHISDTDALMVKALAAKGAFNTLTPEQLNFLQQEHVNELPVIPGNAPDAIVARELLRLRLIARNNADPIFGNGNVGTNAATLIAAAKAFDPVQDVVVNGVKIINILANVYVSIAQKLGPQRYQGDILTPVASNYAAFGKLIESEPYYQARRDENRAILALAGFAPSGNEAQDVWNVHLVAVAILVDATTTYNVALKAGNVTDAMKAAVANATLGVDDHAPQLAGLFSMSLGIPPFKVLGFPGPENL